MNSFPDSIRVVIDSVADTETMILLRGEPGVGKDFVARAIHAGSRRRAGPFIKVNNTEIPAGLLESELFGHEKGAFRGAHRRKPGQFEFATGGTILLEEIAEIPLALQTKLLQVLQDLRFCRLGGQKPFVADIRVIASTNRELGPATARGPFREALYDRLHVVEIRIPPLRERPEVIPLLASRFLARFNEQYGRTKELAPRTLASLTEYAWPGNVRELETVMRRIVVRADGDRAFETRAARSHNGQP